MRGEAGIRLKLKARPFMRAGAATLLLLFFAAPSAVCAPAYGGFSPPDEIGAPKIPRIGNSRVALIVISSDAKAADAVVKRSFFSNDLDTNTFRNYWHENSLSAYDPTIVTFVVDPAGKDLPKDIARQGPMWDKKRQSALAEILNGLSADKKFEPATFDINGKDRMPDGHFDGMIVILDNLQTAYFMYPEKNDDATVVGVKLGPTVFFGAGASNFEILRGFAQLLGFTQHDELCLSLLGNPIDIKRDSGFPMIDGFSRLRAGWARRMDIKGGLRQVFMLPARTSGEAYVVGGEDEKEYFLIENRGPGGGYDADLRSPGLAVYHVDESRMYDSVVDVWHPVVLNLWPDSSFPIRLGLKFDSDSALFRTGDSISSDYLFQNPIDEKEHPLSTNWYGGEPSDILIKEIDTESHFPLISVVTGVE
jgi:hypothetical protein